MAIEKYKLELDEKQVISLGLLFDQILKQTGVQFIDVVYELRLQIRDQMPKPEDIPEEKKGNTSE